MNTRILKNLCAAALLCFLPVVAFAGPDGIWAGTVTKGNSTISVRASFDGTKVNLHFTGAEGCQITATYDKADGRELYYRFGIATNGGAFCDSLISNSLQVKYTEGEDTMTIAFASGGKWTGDLGKQN